ncbi:MAG TPA: lysophospholipid acyltransferase family protein [Candidatus Eisenbacteria bacterium]
MTSSARVSFRHRLEAFLLRALSGFFCLLPHRLAVRTGGGLGWLVSRVAPIRSKVADENLRRAFPLMGEAERRDILDRFYRHLGRMLAEFLRSPALDAARIVEWTNPEGEEHLKAAAAEGRGVVMISGHLGNWEWLVASAAARGYALDVIVAPQKNIAVQDFITRCRAGVGVGVLYSKRGRGELLEAGRRLRKGHLLGTLVDQDAGRRGWFVDFLGSPASAAVGTFRMALAARAPVVCVFTWREGFRHHVVAEPALVRDPTLDDEAQAREWAAEFHRRLEARIRAHPEQWFWVHRRWRSRPANEAAPVVPGPGRAMVAPDPGSAA